MTSPAATTKFPVDDALPLLLDALAEQPLVILQAPPGAGKTTRVPPALLKLPTLEQQSILMLEPRRLAAVNAAAFMAQQMSEEVGKTVGYTIRYDRKVSATTRIEVVTEGVLTRRLQSDPELNGVGLVLFDEFHERNLHSDLALALCRDAQQGLRPDLKIIIMSATLETETLSRLLDNAPVIRSEGKMYPIDQIYAAQDTTVRSLTTDVEATTARALQQTRGDILVFMPGAYEIRRAVEALRNQHPNIDICPLYGGLPLADQRRAIEAGPRRKVVVATNVAETSLTIEGVRSVIDSGFEKRPRFDAARSLTTLETVRISKASARQRQGRAGRLGPGACYRLWSEGTQGALLPQAPPEIAVADLAPLALDLANWGVTAANSLTWVDPPPDGHLSAGRQLLQQLGALDHRWQLTAIGERLARIPAHPRLGRLLVQAENDNCPELGADLVALLSEQLGSKKIPDLIDSLRQSGAESAPANLKRAMRFWRKQINGSNRHTQIDQSEVARLLAVAWPDHIARQRQGHDLQYLLANGMAATLDINSPLRGCKYLIVVDLHGRTRSEVRISTAVGYDPDDFEQTFGKQADWQRQVEWDGERQQVIARDVRCHGALILQSRPAKATPDDRRTALLEWITRKGLELLPWSRESQALRQRLAFLSAELTDQGWPDFSDAALLADLPRWLGPYLDKINAVSQLSRVDLKQALLSRLEYRQQKQLAQLAPERIKVPSGSNVRIDYAGSKPVLAVKLQELFGLADSPHIVNGKIPILIHLLSPAGRPLQVTADLKSFWENVYPEVKKEMKGRYPKHPWPDDPWSAEPTRRTNKRR